MKKVLIVKLGAIGDVVMALPMLAHLRAEGPVHITWVSGKVPAPLLRATGLVDELIEVDEVKLLKEKRISELFSLWGRLLGRSFDLVATAHADWRYRLLTKVARAKKRTHFVSRGRYHVVEYLDLVGGSEAPFPKLQLPTIPYGEKRFVAIAPGGAKNVLSEQALRRWPVEHYVELVKRLYKEGVEVVVTGDKSDEWVLPHFSGLTFENLIGKLDLLELIALYQKCELLIVHDSGPLHLAKLAKCRVIALFGPTSPVEKVGLSEGIEVIWGGENLSCRPCYNGKTYAKCSNNLCLSGISVDQVLGKRHD